MVPKSTYQNAGERSETKGKSKVELLLFNFSLTRGRGGSRVVQVISRNPSNV